MSGIPIGGKTISTSTGRFLSLSPRAPMTSLMIMAPDQQANTTQDDKEDVPISDLFPSFDQALATFLHDSFDVPKESHSTLCEALINGQYRTWSDFLFIENIDDLAYQDSGTRRPLAWHVQLKLQRFIDFGRHLTKQGLDWEERNHYTKEAFKAYLRGIVKATRDSAADRVVAHRGTPPDGPGPSPKPIAQLKYESWIRKPRDKTIFPVLPNDAAFEHWLVQFKAQLDANGINPATFLDPYWPDHVLTGYPKALHEKQCAFFWTLLRHVFQGDFSSSCVLYHQGTRDGRQAYFDFVALHNPVSPPTPPAAPVVSSPAPISVRPSAVGTVTPSTTRVTPVQQSTPNSACETDVHSHVANPANPTGLAGCSNPGSTADSTYTWKYSPSTDSVRFSKVDPSSTPSIVPADIPTGDVPSQRTREPHSTRNRESRASHSPRARTFYPPPTNSRWTFYPQSETVVFHCACSAPQPSCHSSLQLPPSGASSKDSVISSSVRKPLYGASFCPIQKFLYRARKSLYGASFTITDKYGHITDNNMLKALSDMTETVDKQLRD
eukprot:jgi/Psemu1/37123/gm1.37123_g